MKDVLQILDDVAGILEKSARMGAERDDPEGSRYIQISDTLAVSLANRIRDALVSVNDSFLGMEDDDLITVKELRPFVRDLRQIEAMIKKEIAAMGHAECQYGSYNDIVEPPEKDEL